LQTPHPTEQKQTQVTIQEQAAPHVCEQIPIQNHSAIIEEALRLAAPIFILLPQVISFIGPNPLFIQQSKLTPMELNIITQFYMFLNINPADVTLEDKF